MRPKKNKGSRVCIIGMGLMGASLGMALVRNKKTYVMGVGRNLSHLKEAKKRKALHDYTANFKEGVKDADVVILALPVAEIPIWAKKIYPYLSKECLVMDVGSVKAPLVKQIEKIHHLKEGPQFIGAHPMAGSEKTGVKNAQPDLYQGATCILTPTLKTSKKTLKTAEIFWQRLGTRIVRLLPQKHDEWIALVSHLPHLLAQSLLLSTSQQRDGLTASLLAAGSFRDLTRVGSADPFLWNQIFQMNSKNLKKASNLFIKNLSKLNREGWPNKELKRSKQFYENYIKGKSK